jgi:hypothetical protein
MGDDLTVRVLLPRCHSATVTDEFATQLLTCRLSPPLGFISLRRFYLILTITNHPSPLNTTLSCMLDIRHPRIAQVA